jgi:excisionase family DNA binding protein
MISGRALAAAEGLVEEKKPRVIDQIATASQPSEGDLPDLARKRINPPSRQHPSATPRGPPDDLEKLIGSQLVFTVAEMASLVDRSQATIYRLLRLGLLDFVQIGGSRMFTRAIVLDFLRNGISRSRAA